MCNAVAVYLVIESDFRRHDSAMIVEATFDIRFHDLKAIFRWIQTTVVWRKSNKMLVVSCVDNHTLLHSSTTKCVMKEMCAVYN